MEMRTKWLGYKEKAQAVLKLVLAQGPSARTKKVAHELLGRLVTSQDLRRWADAAPDAETAASELFIRERRISRKTLGDYRRLWGQSEAIEEAWRAFAGYFDNLAPEEQRRLVPLAQPPASPPAASSPPRS
jgi:hypothetical protein